jgi:hypothetical protein
MIEFRSKYFKLNQNLNKERTMRLFSFLSILGLLLLGCSEITSNSDANKVEKKFGGPGLGEDSNDISNYVNIDIPVRLDVLIQVSDTPGSWSNLEYSFTNFSGILVQEVPGIYSMYRFRLNTIGTENYQWSQTFNFDSDNTNGWQYATSYGFDADGDGPGGIQVINIKVKIPGTP